MTNGISPNRPLPSLPQARDQEISLETLAPWIQKYASKYGANPQIMAGIVAQESSFVNLGVHRDGTGHGLVGLDDNGLLPDFEKWSGVRVGRGRQAKTIAPEKQIEFLARRLSELTRKFHGREWDAVRAWHGGVKGRDRAHAREYEQLIRGRIPQIAAAVPRNTTGAEAPSGFELAVAAPVKLRVDEGRTPIARSIELGDEA